MTLLFGQFPQGALVSGQLVIHSYVGSIGDIIEPPSSDDNSGNASPRYIRRDSIKNLHTINNDEDIICALTFLFALDDANTDS